MHSEIEWHEGDSPVVVYPCADLVWPEHLRQAVCQQNDTVAPVNRTTSYVLQGPGRVGEGLRTIARGEARQEAHDPRGYRDRLSLDNLAGRQIPTPASNEDEDRRSQVMQLLDARGKIPRTP